MKSGNAELSVTVTVRASAGQVFDGLTEWSAQSEWMLGTTVQATSLKGRAVGATLSAFTGIGRLGFTDTMTITVWDPPRQCSVTHTGHIVRGDGDFIVRSVDEGQSTCTWSEHISIPFGVVGRLAWPIVKPLARLALRVSLQRFAKWVEMRAVRHELK